LNSLQK
jgi:hypothetical protein